MIELIFLGILIIVAAYIIIWWIQTYNLFISWKNMVEQKFAAIDVIMERRINMLPALTQIAQKYGVHEYKTIKDTIEARGKWTKDMPISEKIPAVEAVANGLLNIQAVFEKYPNIKADQLYQKIMGRGNVSEVEEKLESYRLHYNYVVNLYNTRVQLFPKNIVAQAHNFKVVPYLILGNKINNNEHGDYDPKSLFV